MASTSNTLMVSTDLLFLNTEHDFCFCTLLHVCSSVSAVKNWRFQYKKKSLLIYQIINYQNKCSKLYDFSEGLVDLKCKGFLTLSPFRGRAWPLIIPLIPQVVCVVVGVLVMLMGADAAPRAPPLRTHKKPVTDPPGADMEMVPLLLDANQTSLSHARMSPIWNHSISPWTYR